MRLQSQRVCSVLMRARIDMVAQQIACVVICRLMFECLEVILELCLKTFPWHTNIYLPATVDLPLLLSCRYLLPNLALLTNPGQVRSERLCLCIRVASVFQRLIPCSWRGGTVAIFERDHLSLDGTNTVIWCGENSSSPPLAFLLRYCFSNMSFHGSGGTWPRSWAQQTHDHRDAEHAQDSDGYNSQNPHAGAQFSSKEPIYQYRYARSGILQYSYNEQGLPRASYSQGTATSTGNCPSQAAATGFAGGYRSVPYTNIVPQYSQQYVAVVFNSC
jgi:hypothetical protein